MGMMLGRGRRLGASRGQSGGASFNPLTDLDNLDAFWSPDLSGATLSAASVTITVGYFHMGGDTLTIGANVLTEGVDFDRGSNNTECSANLTAAIDALSGYSASDGGGTVTVTADDDTASFAYACSDTNAFNATDSDKAFVGTDSSATVYPLCSQVNDETGNGNHLVQATRANQPHYVHNGGAPYLASLKGTSHMRTSAAGGLTNGDDVSVLMIANQTAVATNAIMQMAMQSFGSVVRGFFAGSNVANGGAGSVYTNGTTDAAWHAHLNVQPDGNGVTMDLYEDDGSTPFDSVTTNSIGISTGNEIYCLFSRPGDLALAQAADKLRWRGGFYARDLLTAEEIANVMTWAATYTA